MSEDPRQIVLLAAYEELTQKESVCIREDRMEATIELQKKKAKLIAKIQELESISPVSGKWKTDLTQKVSELQQVEAENSRILEGRMRENRTEYRSLIKATGSANKVRNAYGISQEERKKPTSLKDQA